jgi:hypothetical protein
MRPLASAAALLVLSLIGCESHVVGDALDAATELDTPLAPDVSDARMDTASPSLEFEHDWSEGELCAVETTPDCCAEARLELPATAASVLDLRGLESGAAGTCGDPIKQVLPSDPSAYPLMVLLPELTGADPFCATACAGRGRATTFGIALTLPDALSLAYRPLVVAPPPWQYVYDHNSLAGDCCLDGYQEFGERACVRTNYGGAIGFATGAATTPVRAALIDLQEGVNGAVDTCCPYLPNRS